MHLKKVNLFIGSLIQLIKHYFNRIDIRCQICAQSTFLFLDNVEDQEGSEIDGPKHDIIQNKDTNGTHSVAIGNESDPEDSSPTQNSDKTVQTEQVRRQQSCSSRASLDSQRSISFFVDFDDCDINGNDSVFSGTYDDCTIDND